MSPKANENEVNGASPSELPSEINFGQDGGAAGTKMQNNNSAVMARPHYARLTSLCLGITALAAATLGVFYFLKENDVELKKDSTVNDNFQGTVSAASLAEHNVPEDCWLAIHDRVYDLTEYAPTHPGEQIKANCCIFSIAFFATGFSSIFATVHSTLLTSFFLLSFLQVGLNGLLISVAWMLLVTMILNIPLRFWC